MKDHHLSAAQLASDESPFQQSANIRQEKLHMKQLRRAFNQIRGARLTASRLPGQSQRYTPRRGFPIPEAIGERRA